MLKKLEFRPGIVRSNTDYAEPGRYVDAQWARFDGGFPQKMGGWTDPGYPALTGVTRAILPWRDNDETTRIAFGTHSKLLVLTNGTLIDVTPLRGRNTGALVDPIATTNGSATVTINHTAHHQIVGDWVTLTATTYVGGVAVAGNYIIQSVPTVDSYTITSASAATSTTTGGGSTAYTYFRLLLGPDPITTTAESETVEIADAGNLVTEGDTVIISGADPVGNITLSGAYVVTSATSAGYSVTASLPASITASGGGAVVFVQNEINVGLINSLVGAGYGAGRYSAGAYGTPRSSSTITLALRTWALDAYGEWLLANPRGGGIYVWTPDNPDSRAIALYGAPTECLSMFVTAERYIIALGADGDGLKIRWPDQLDPTAWTSTLANTANESRRIQGGNYLLRGGQVRSQTSLLFTDTSLFLMQWRADDFIFTTAKLADNCGLFGPNAFTAEGDAAYWVGDGQFWKWDGALDQLPADDIRDWFFKTVDREQRAKVFMASIATFNELIVLYQESGQSEVNRYLLYNIKDRTWATGSVARTAWRDRGLLTYPVATDASGNFWYHEYGVDANGEAIDSYVVAAPIDIDDGNVNLDILGFWPDFKDQVGAMSVYVLTRDLAAQTPVSEGPYALTSAGEAIDIRLSGKMAGYKIESNVVGGNYRLGVNRVEAQPAGSRR